MKMYKVNVNGTVYEVSIEVMDGVPAAPAAPPADIVLLTEIRDLLKK